MSLLSHRWWCWNRYSRSFHITQKTYQLMERKRSMCGVLFFFRLLFFCSFSSSSSSYLFRRGAVAIACARRCDPIRLKRKSISLVEIPSWKKATGDNVRDNPDWSQSKSQYIHEIFIKELDQTCIGKWETLRRIIIIWLEHQWEK